MQTVEEGQETASSHALVEAPAGLAVVWRAQTRGAAAATGAEDTDQTSPEPPTSPIIAASAARFFSDRPLVVIPIGCPFESGFGWPYEETRSGSIH
jgi:hypothetical protein